MLDAVGSSSWLLFGALTLLPFVFVASTSFVKLSFVLSILRNAIGIGAVPSGLVITTLSAILSAYVMAPVAADVASAAAGSAVRIDWDRPFNGASGEALRESWRLGLEPVRGFLLRNSGARARALFEELGASAGAAAPGESDLLVVLPAFLLTELEEAFQIGFVVFLPFLVVDLFVASTLVALGMTALSPSTVSLPFKLLLFVLVDGWYVLSRALVAGYA